MDSFLSIPIFALAIFIPLLLCSFKYNAKLCVFIFIVICLLFIVGTDILILFLTFIALYSIGFWFNYLLVRVEDYGPLNFVLGFIALYIPVFFFTGFTAFTSAIDSLPITFQPFFVSSKTLAVVVFFVGLICSLTLLGFKREHLVCKINAANSYIEDVDPLTLFLVFLLVSTISYVAMPTIGYDDLAIHYYIQNQVANGEYPSFDVTVNVWSYAQWILNVYYGLMGSYTNGEGRTLLNLFFAATTILISFSVLRNYLSTNASLLLITLASSSPLFILSLTNSQSELVTTFLLVSIFYCFLKYNRDIFLKSLLIFGFSVAIKPSNALVFILPFILFVVNEIYLYRLRILKELKLYFVLMLSTFIGFSVYIFSFVKTGSPVYPLFNEVFKSSGFPPINFFNRLYVGNFEVDAFWGIIFNTSKYLESKDGVAGFQLLILPIAIMCIPFLYKKAKKEVLFFSAVVLSALAMFYSQQYVRYISPSIFVFTLVVTLLFSRLLFKHRLIVFSFYTLISGTIIYNFSHVNNVAWYFPFWKSDYIIMANESDKFVSDNEPILQVNNYLNALRGNVNVVYPVQKPFASNLKGRYIYLNWYNTEGATAFSQGTEELYRYVISKQATHIVILSGIDDALLNVAKKYGKLAYQNSLYDVYEVVYIPRTLEAKVSYFGDVTVQSDKSFNVDATNFALYEYANLRGGNRFELAYEFVCLESGVLRNYIEFDRYTNFSNMMRTYSCNKPGEKQHHIFEFYAPYLTNEIRLFVQSVTGKYKIISVELNELSND